MKLALKVDVDTYRGTRIGVPRLTELFKRHGAGATFLFSLGPDHTGRAIRRAFRPGFLTKVSRTSVVSHYGFPTLLYGTLLPGPDIGKRCAPILRKVRDEGYEVGIHTWDHVEWQDKVGTASQEWTEGQMQRAIDRFQEVFGEKPAVHGAAGWQMSRNALRLTQKLGFSYCSDGRGTHPFIPVAQAEIVACPQFPTTLPTLDEMIGIDGVTEANVAERLLALTATPKDHIFTLHAELEGMKLLPVLEQLLEGWKAQGYQLGATRDQFEAFDSLTTLPLHQAIDATLPGRSGTLSTQGPAFLGT